MPSTSGYFGDRQDVATYLSISRMTLSRWERIKALPGQHLCYRITYLTIKQVDQWRNELYHQFKIERKRGFLF